MPRERADPPADAVPPAYLRPGQRSGLHPGVAILGAVLNSRLSSELAARFPAAIAQLPPGQAAKFGGAGRQISINQPSVIHALPVPLRFAIQASFVEALRVVFLVAGLIAILAIVVTLALPDRELRGSVPGAPAEGAERRPTLAECDDDEAAAEMEARTSTLIQMRLRWRASQYDA